MSLANYQSTWLALTLNPQAEDEILVDDAHFQAWLNQQEGMSASLKTQFSTILLARLRQYAYMVKANLQETLETVFPYTQQLLGDSWEPLVDDYLRAFPPTSYQLYECVKDLPTFLKETPYQEERYPFLAQLASYEEAEAQLLKSVAPQLPVDLSQSVPESLEGVVPILNPVYRLVSGDYAIQSVVAHLQAEADQAAWLPLEVKPTHLWIYVDTAGRCRFYEVNALVLGFLQRLAVDPQQTLLFYLEALMGEQAYLPAVQGQFLHLVNQLVEANVLLGFSS